MILALAASGPASGASPVQVGQEAMTLWEGGCSADSYRTLEGVRAPYKCNALLQVVMADRPGHHLLMFVTKGDQSTVLTFGGDLDAQGDLVVRTSQFEAGISTMVRGRCAIARRDGKPTHIRCEVSATDGRARGALVDFTISGEARIPG